MTCSLSLVQSTLGVQHIHFTAFGFILVLHVKAPAKRPENQKERRNSVELLGLSIISRGKKKPFVTKIEVIIMKKKKYFRYTEKYP